MLDASSYYMGPTRQVILAGDSKADLTQALLKTYRSRFLPNSIVMLADSNSDMKELNGKPTAYVCQNYTCQLPTSEVDRFNELLQ